MINILKQLPLKLTLYALMALSALLLLAGARRSGKCAAQLETLQHNTEALHAQLRARHTAPHTRTSLVDWLRKGKL
jgi:hypothetical protein